MAEENMLKSIVDSAGLSAENVQNVVEMGNDLTDKLSEKVEEVGEEFDKLRSEMGKVISDIITPTEKLGHRIEDEVSEMIKETKEKLEDSVNNVDCAFSGMTSDVTFGDETQKIASENLGYINNEMNRIVEDIGKTIPEKADELEETSDKMERRTESVLEVINKKNELIENVGGIASEITTGFKELCEETVGNRLGEAVDKIHQFAENVDEAVSEKVSTFGSEISEKTSVKLEEGTEKMDELIKGTVEKFQELSEETNKKIVSVEESVREKVKGIKEGIDEKINEINVKMDNEEKDIMHGFDDGERQIVGMSDICVKEGNEDVKKDVLEANPITVTDDFLGVADIGYLQSSTFRKDTEKIKEIVPKSEHDDEAQAIKKIILPGEDVPEQVGTLSESGVYHDDYDMEEPKNIETAKLSDVVNHKADEVDSLLEEAFDFSKKLKEPETVDVVTDQGDDRQLKEAEKADVDANIIDEEFQKEYSNICEGIQRQELHDITIDLNDNSMATGNSKSEMQFTEDEKQKLANDLPQCSPISEQTKLQDEHVGTINDLSEMISRELKLNSADETESRVVQHPEITETSIIASKHVEEQHYSEVAPESGIANEEEAERKIKFISDPSQPEENVKCFTDEDVVDVKKALHAVPDPASNSAPSLTPEDIFKFSMTSTTSENVLQSTIPIKGNDQDGMTTEAEINVIQEKTRPEVQSAKTSFAEKSVNRSDPPNRAPPPSPESAVSLRLPVLPPKNVPPPVPPKKKSIEMILAEEARAMGQRSLRGFETLVQGTQSPEIEKDQIKSENKTKQNVEIPTIEEQAEVAKGEGEAKRETMQESESEKTDTTLVKKIQKFEAQKKRAHPILPMAEGKSETVSGKDKTDTMKSKNSDGQQQQTRRCTIL